MSAANKLVAEMFTEENSSLVKQHLTQDIYDSLQGIKSKEVGYTVDDAIKTCIDNQDSGVGIYAGDEDSYKVFSPIFNPIIKTYHGGYDPTTDTHKSDMNPDNLTQPDEKFDDYVISTRIRVGRNIAGYGLSPGITREQRKELEELVTTALNGLEGELKGTYYPLTGMEEETRQKLVDDHFLFKKGDRFLESCGANRDWPESRGIYHNDDKTFLVWVNEEDQLRIISMQKGADFKQIFSRLAAGIKAIEGVLAAKDKKYQFNDQLGFIHSCPSNLGTGMRASVHIKVPKLSANKDAFYKRCADLKLQPRGVHGEHSETTDGIYDISNKHRIGYTEVQLVQTMIDGVAQLIKEEAAL